MPDDQKQLTKQDRQPTPDRHVTRTPGPGPKDEAAGAEGPESRERRERG